jgi:hypothetical protein
MRATMTQKRLGTFLLLAAAVFGCSSGGGDDAAKFAGPWTFAEGELAATCTLITAPPPFSLAGLGVEISRVSSSQIDVSAGSTGKCKVRFNVAGTKATAITNPPQSCILEVGSFGEQTLGVTAWTLELDGDQLNTTLSGKVLVCTLGGSGVLVRGAPDGGVRDGGSDAGDASNPDATADTHTGGDALPDVATSDASDAGADASDDATDATGG